MAVLTPFCTTYGTNDTIRGVDANGIISTFPLTSTDPVFLAHVGFHSFAGLAFDGAGNLYASELNGAAIYRISPSLQVTRVIGTIPPVSGNAGDGGPAGAATIGLVHAIHVDLAGNLYLTDQQFGVIRAINMQATAQTLLGIVIQPGCIQRVAGNGNSSTGHFGGSIGDGGPATAAEIDPLGDFALDGAGNLYIAHAPFSWDRVRRIDHATGIITTLAGIAIGGGSPHSGDGGPANLAGLNGPVGVACDAAGNVYISCSGNDDCRVRVVNMQPTTQILLGISVGAGCIQTVAGTAIHGYNGDGMIATSAELKDPGFIALDGAGNLYICDLGSPRIRVVDAITLLISTVAGTGLSGSTGDGGPATAARIQDPRSVAVFFIPSGPSVKERRFACNGAFESSSAYGDVLKSLALSMAGFVVPPGDCWRVYAGSFVPPEVTLADADCRSSIKGEFRLSARDTCNGVKGQYIPAFLPINPLGPLSASPASAAWKKTDFPPVQRANYIAEDGGRILWKDIQLDFTISLWMAQRIGRIVLERLRRQITISLPAKLTGVALLAADTMQFLHPRWGTVNPPVPTTFQVAHTSLRVEAQADGVPAFGTDLILRETDEKVYEFAEPTSPTDFGDYSGYGQTGIGAGNVQ